MTFFQSYVAWQVHEPSEGQYDFHGENDIFEFLHLAQKTGLLVILRPGPFIDAERDFGGLPSWLLKKKNIELRTSKDEFFMASVKRWFSVLLPLLRPLIYRNGGPIIMMQVYQSLSEKAFAFCYLIFWYDSQCFVILLDYCISLSSPKANCLVKYEHVF